MDRAVFTRKTQRNRKSCVDRFVFHRDTIPEVRRRLSWHDKYDPNTDDIWQSTHQRQRRYKSYLDKALGLEPLKSQETEEFGDSWPCAPRRRCYLSSADSILDLPAYNYAAFPEVLDWSSSNILVAALGTSYHMFGWREQNVMGQGMTPYGIHCCKFDPAGELLLIGTAMQTIELHNILWGKSVSSSRCHCYKEAALCAVTAVDWSPTGNSFVAGCSRGVVSTFDRSALLVNRWRGFRASILSVKVSPDARYVAVATVNSPLVHVLVWPSLLYISSLNSNWVVKTITWHPWRSALLGVGAVNSSLQTTIALWATPAAKLRETGLGHYNQYSFDTMLFSHRTGELVLSLWNQDQSQTYPKSCSQLVVMSDPYTVVDQSGEGASGIDRVRTMVFSPDGTKLATATADEDLIIWNFLPEDNKKKNCRPRRFCAIPAYLDQVTQGFVLR